MRRTMNGTKVTMDRIADHEIPNFVKMCVHPDEELSLASARSKISQIEGMKSYFG